MAGDDEMAFTFPFDLAKERRSRWLGDDPRRGRPATPSPSTCASRPDFPKSYQELENILGGSPGNRNVGGAAAGGGRSEVKRSRAGSSHGEPRTESPSEDA